MRLTLLILWLTVPLAVAAYHFGPGQDRLKHDSAASHLASARAAAADDHAPAIASLEAALAALPEADVAESRQIRLALAKLRLESGDLPKGHDELVALFNELDGDAAADPALRDQTRQALATAKYYITWLMRLEGLPEETWEPEIEASRQHFRLLAEQAEKGRNHQALTLAQGNLENSVRLARMDLSELEGLPIPKQCKNCKSGKCKNPATKKPEQKPQDSRKAGKGPPVDGSGS